MSAKDGSLTTAAGPNGEYVCDTTVPCGDCGATEGVPCPTNECMTWGEQ